MSLTAPANGATFTAPATIPITASVTGTVSRVDFYASGTLIGSAASSPYTMTGTNVAAGTYALTAVAVPTSGASVTSAPITVTVNAATNTTPTVALTSPSSGSSFTAPATIALTAAAADPTDRIAKVDFYSGTTLLGTATASPYAMTWRNVAAGGYSITAKATDSLGDDGDVHGGRRHGRGQHDDFQRPTVSLTAPANGATFTAPATIPITASVTGTVSRVDFYASGTLVGSAASSPYTMTGTNVVAGTYVLTAVAVPASGASVTSAPINITVNGATNTTPTVTLTSPASGSSFTAPATVTLTATATDPTDAITKVDFYSGTTLLGTATASPYAITWSNVAAGAYSVTAKATDGAGATATSAADAITVTATNTTPPPPGGLVYAANLVHQGSFHVPGGIHAGGQANAGFEYGGTALTFNPAKNSLYMVGHDWDQFTGEVSIPSLGGTASLLQMLVDSTEGKLPSVNPSDSGSKKIGGMLALPDRLIITGFSFYDGAGTQAVSHFSRPLNLSTTGQVNGPYRVGSLGGGFYAGYMGMVPASWQGALGGAAVTGQCCLSVISRTSYGPALFAFDPTSSGQTAVPLVYYTGTNPLEPYGAGGIASALQRHDQGPRRRDARGHVERALLRVDGHGPLLLRAGHERLVAERHGRGRRNGRPGPATTRPTAARVSTRIRTPPSSGRMTRTTWRP